jgi:hypothetical protein
MHPYMQAYIKDAKNTLVLEWQNFHDAYRQNTYMHVRRFPLFYESRKWFFCSHTYNYMWVSKMKSFAHHVQTSSTSSHTYIFAYIHTKAAVILTHVHRLYRLNLYASLREYLPKNASAYVRQREYMYVSAQIKNTCVSAHRSICKHRHLDACLHPAI